MYEKKANTLVSTEDGITTYFRDTRGVPRTNEEMDWAIANNYIIKEFRIKREDIDTELLLDFVDLKLDWYIPSVDAFDFINFIRLCIGEEPENLSPKAHYFFIDTIFKSKDVKPYFDVRNIDYDFLKGNTLILSTREFSKSTLICYLVLYMAAKGKLPGFGRVNFGMYVSDKMDGNVKNTMETIEGLYLGSKYLHDQFEWTHFTNGSIEMIRKPKTVEEIKIYNRHMKTRVGKIETVPMRSKRKFKLAGLGCSGGRGSRSILDRPQFAIFDDMIGNEKDAFSNATLESIESTIEGDVGSSLSSNGHFTIMIGTAYHTADPIYKRVNAGTHVPIVFPKSELINKGIITTNKKDGKRGFRVYPKWNKTTNKQAEKTQKWQLNYFYEINEKTDFTHRINTWSIYKWILSGIFTRGHYQIVRDFDK